jgi:hypothetical protein
MAAEMVSETLGFNPKLTLPVAREDFIEFSRRESFKSYVLPSQISLGLQSANYFHSFRPSNNNNTLLTVKISRLLLYRVSTGYPIPFQKKYENTRYHSKYDCIAFLFLLCLLYG